MVRFGAVLLLACAALVRGHVPPLQNGTSSGEKYFALTVQLEEQFRGVLRGTLRPLMPLVLRLSDEEGVSGGCKKALMRYLKGLQQAKLWAVRMLDATSKLPPGILQGTFVDYGSFDECLDVVSPFFKGQSCALEAKPPLPPLPPHFYLAKVPLGGNNGTLGGYFRAIYGALHHKRLRLVACVPSSCSLRDMQAIARTASEETDFDIQVPQCYKKEEEIPLRLVHWTLFVFLGVLTILCLLGDVLKSRSSQKPTKFRGSSTEFACLHGARFLSMCWVVLGHTYVLVDFELLKDPSAMQGWFRSLWFEPVHNGWLAVETFFLISGILATFGGLRYLQENERCFNVPQMVLRRYLRLAPSLLLMMGLVFLLPLLGSGPFWYEHVDPQVDSCTQYWWTTLLFVSNWFGIDKGCTLVTWYMAADFQLHVLTLCFLPLFHRHSRVGVAVLVASIAASCAAVALQTLVNDVMPAVMLSAADDENVMHALNHVHVFTPTHLGPYCIGMIMGYIVFKHREQRISKTLVMMGWCASVVSGVSSLLGVHRFSTGDETSRSLAITYAALHRTAFAAAVAWVLHACVTGRGGPVNALLSSAVFFPFSRLSFLVYLLHPLVIWTRLGSLRERLSTTHYDFLYEYVVNLVTSFAVAVPFYLLLEAPLSNIERTLRSNPRNGQSSKNEIAKQNDPSPNKNTPTVHHQRI